MSTDTERDQAIKAAVRERYARAVTAVPESPAGCQTPARPKGTLARLAGYDAGEVAALPAGAVENSFGCGNPLAFAGVRPGDVVLDLGSGAGIDCLLAARRVGPTGRVIGLDMTPAMIERATAHAREAGLDQVEFRLGEMERMPVADASVDWVISNCVICLSPDKPAVFREIARVLKPGGQLSVADVVAEALPQLLAGDPAAWSACLGGAIPEPDYLAGLRAAGLAAARVEARLVYERSQIAAFVENAIARLSPAAAVADALRAEVDRLTGKVWSARIRAERPLVDTAGRPVAIRAATAADLGAIHELLRGGELPADDVGAHLAHFLVAESGGQLSGVAGMERYGPDALFRSLAVTAAERGHGLARALMGHLVRHARESEVERAWALTLSIPALLERWGFRAVDRDAAPVAIRTTGQFKGCCASAPLFVLDLGTRDLGTRPTGQPAGEPATVGAPTRSSCCAG